MIPTIYKFSPRLNQMKNDKDGEVVFTADYFEFYHTGIENLPVENSSLYFETDRYENERSEVVTHTLLNSEHLSDLSLALNNDVYWWDSPMDYDTKIMVIQHRLNLTAVAKHRKLTPAEIEYYGSRYFQQIENESTIQQKVVLPRYKNIQRVIRNIKKYLDNRKVY